ncbi:MAG TPA: hypothetical protein VGM88_02590 [Kofleriaceae bacterium]|jgi:hypothetical protein
MRRAALPAAIALVIGGAVTAFLVEESRADLDGQVFTSRADSLRLVVPRGWRASDQASYPGVILWMMRSSPAGTMMLTGEDLTHALYCSWPVQCRTEREALSTRYACALREKLAAQRFKVGPIEPGPRETDAQGLPIVWFEYDDGKRFLRQAVAVGAEGTTDTQRAISLVLTASSSTDRTTHVRAFEQALRSIERTAPMPALSDVVAPALAVDAALPDASHFLADASFSGTGPGAKLAPESVPDAGLDASTTTDAPLPDAAPATPATPPHENVFGPCTDTVLRR